MTLALLVRLENPKNPFQMQAFSVRSAPSFAKDIVIKEADQAVAIGRAFQAAGKMDFSANLEHWPTLLSGGMAGRSAVIDADNFGSISRG